MSFSESEYQSVLRAIHSMHLCLDGQSIRTAAGEHILNLLQADYFASFVWNPAAYRFDDCVQINMSEENLAEYDSYYQFHDPITGELQKRSSATAVCEVMPQRELVKTEFFNDFLYRDGLYYGINLFVYHDGENIGDVRVWRKRGRGNFDKGDAQRLNLLAPHFTNAMKNSRLAGGSPVDAHLGAARERFQLTRRETEIAGEIARGQTDLQISGSLGVAYSTLRTHLKRIYKKADVHNRTELVSVLLGIGKSH